MDEKPYKSICDLYAYLDKHAAELSDKDISYMLGVLKTLKDLYGSEANIDPFELHPPYSTEEPSVWQRIWRGLSGK